MISDNTNNIVDNNSDLILPSVPENNNTQVETSVITNNDVVVNPLLSDNSLPVLELPENHPTNDNLNVNVINDSSLGENVSNFVEDATSPTAQKELDLSSEKEEFLKYCSEFFDKIIEKIEIIKNIQTEITNIYKIVYNEVARDSSRVLDYLVCA